MARILIPTRNRPTSLGGVLGFLDRFYPDAQVIIADGSGVEYRQANAAVVEQLGRLTVDYRWFDPSLPFFERILSVLESEPDEHIIMGSDDDYPLMDVLAEAERTLIAHVELGTVLSGSVKFTLVRPTEMRARLNLARSILQDDAGQRVADFAAWSFPTTYAVTRREVLIDRYRHLHDAFLTGFVDFTIGVRDCLLGKIGTVPDLGYFRTANYGHSYLRPRNGLSFLERAPDVLRLVTMIENDLVTVGGLSRSQARDSAETAIRHRIAELCGRHRQGMPEIGPKTVADDPALAAQYQTFTELFVDGSPIREGRREQLAFISDAVRASAESTDNADEPATVETLEDQRL